MWNAIHAERAGLAEMLNGLSAEQWALPSLCPEWTVEQVVAHLTAAAKTGTFAWIRSIVRAGFDADKRNARLLAKHMGEDHSETFAEYQRSISLTTAPTKDYAAVLGEVIVHSQDIAQPLGIKVAPVPESVAGVAHFYATKDFAVNSKTLVQGLQLQADDAPFDSGSGPIIRGSVLDLVMVMAGRRGYIDSLEGDGVSELRSRLD